MKIRESDEREGERETDRGIIDLSGVNEAAVTPAGVIPLASSCGGFAAE